MSNNKEEKKYFNEGIAELKRGAYEDAIAKFTEAIKINPNDVLAYHNRGVAKAELKQYDDAIVDFGKAVEINPDFISAYIKCFYVKKMLGWDDDAVADYDEVRRIGKDWIKANKEEVRNRFCAGAEPNEFPFAVFMCGSSGAGKTEEARRLKEGCDSMANPCVHIDQDAIKAMIPGYVGANAEMFQFSASIGAELVLTYCYRNGLNFIMDSTFSKYEKAKENIERAVNKGRNVQIVYVYQDPLKTWRFVKMRESVEKRSVPIDAFVNSYFGAFETLKRIKEDYGSAVSLRVVNKETGETYGDVDKVDLYVKMSYSNSTELKSAIEKWKKPTK